MLASVMQQGTPTWSDDQQLILNRNGYLEECYFIFSYSPIRDETGAVGGIFTAVSETTQRVLGERRLRMLRELAMDTAEAKTAEEACERSARTLSKNPHDVPFALLSGRFQRLSPMPGRTRTKSWRSLKTPWWVVN